MINNRQARKHEHKIVSNMTMLPAFNRMLLRKHSIVWRLMRGRQPKPLARKKQTGTCTYPVFQLGLKCIVACLVSPLLCMCMYDAMRSIFLWRFKALDGLRTHNVPPESCKYIVLRRFRATSLRTYCYSRCTGFTAARSDKGVINNLAFAKDPNLALPPSSPHPPIFGHSFDR